MPAECDCLIFQDVMKEFLDPKPPSATKDDTVYDEDGEVTSIMFELANSPLVGYRVSASASSATTIVVRQDINVRKHTGGIVWETAYLLLQYLQTKEKLGKTLEVGAGCGMLGQVLAAQMLSRNVVMTEHRDVLPNLKANLDRNQTKNARVCELDWEHCERDVAASDLVLIPHSFDTIVGTDVVFTPTLVEPLYKTLQFMSHANTNVYLCLQERCARSHQLLLDKAAAFGFDLQDISSQFDGIASCRWGTSLECRLLHMMRKKC